MPARCAVNVHASAVTRASPAWKRAEIVETGTPALMSSSTAWIAGCGLMTTGAIGLSRNGYGSAAPGSASASNSIAAWPS